MCRENHSRKIIYKGVEFEVFLENQNEATIRAIDYPIEIQTYYFLDKPIMEYIHKAIDDVKIEKLIESFDEFYK